jgi:peptidyl-prolyl cis-trans isomerase A (cyclophilin A)
MPKIGRHGWLAALIAISSLLPRISNATVVEFQTVMGNFEVNFYDNATPATVANFLDYVNNGGYTSSVFHRSVSGFVVQGGGFIYNMAFPLDAVTENGAVDNEPEFSNVRGTIAMAKLANDPDSATSQWYFNLANNSANLDGQNGGFTVFGQVVGNGMSVVDAIAALPVYDFGGATGELPLQNYTAADFTNNVPVDDTHLVIISAVIVSDSTVDSATGLNPPVNTANQPGPPPASGGSGGGSFGIFSLLGLLLLRRKQPGQ